MSKYSLPSDDRLEHLIRESFEHMPGPQMARLDLIEQRLRPVLSRQPAGRKVNKTPWWVVLFLTGGFAAAAWWAGERIMGRENQVIDSASPGLIEPAESARTGVDRREAEVETLAGDQKPGPVPEKESPVIYQRETM